MIRCFLYVLFTALCATQLQALQTEPSANKFESEVIKRAINEKDSAKKTEIFAQAISDKDASAALFFNAANCYAINGDLKSARNCYDAAIKAFANFYAAYKNRAYVEMGLSDFATARADFSKALELSQADGAKVYAALGKCHFELKNFSEALTCFKNSLMLEPENEEVMRMEAMCLMELKNSKELEILCVKLLKKNPREAVYWRLLARINMEAGKPLEAIAALEAMSDLKIASVQDSELLADLYMSNSMLKEAAKIYLKKSLSSEKSHKLALMFAANGFIKEAEELLQNIDSSSADYWDALAEIKIKKNQNADSELEKAYEKNPLNSRIAILLADSLLQKKEFERAEILYKSASKSYPLESEFGIAKICIARLEYKKAAQILKAASSKFNKPELLDYAKKIENL